MWANSKPQITALQGSLSHLPLPTSLLKNLFLYVGRCSLNLTLCWHSGGIFNNLEHGLIFLCINTEHNNVINGIVSCHETGKFDPEPVLGGKGRWSLGKDKSDYGSFSPELACLTMHPSGLSSFFGLCKSC